MIGYVTLGTNDLKRAVAFYDKLAEALGIGRMMDLGRGIIWGKPDGSASFGVLLPYDGNPATAGNGTMVAFQCASTQEVDRIYQLAMDAGATDEGPPGMRWDGFYAGYFRDLDGNKLNVFWHDPEQFTGPPTG